VNDASEPLLLTVPEVAQRLTVGRSTVYTLMNAGELTSVRVRGCRRIPAAELASYISRLAGGEH
jgi:excisionase family DNA binding protein